MTSIIIPLGGTNNDIYLYANPWIEYHRVCASNATVIHNNHATFPSTDRQLFSDNSFRDIHVSIASNDISGYAESSTVESFPLNLLTTTPVTLYVE